MSVMPPWESAHRLVSEQHDLTGVRIAYVADIAGIGIDHGIAAACRAAALGLKDAGATVEEIDFDLSFGKEAFLALRGESMVGNHLNRLDKLDQLGANLRGNIEAGLKLTIMDIARAEHIRAEVWHRWRALFEQYDFLLTPTVPVEPFPVEQNYPEVINGKPLATYIEWVAQTFLPSLAALARGQRAGRPQRIRSAGWSADRRAALLASRGILGVAKFVEQANPLGLPPNCA